MANEDSPTGERFNSLSRFNWQTTSLYVLAFGLVGIVLAVHTLVGHDSRATDYTLHRLFPALVYGLVALVVLFHFHWLQKDTLAGALKQELVQQKIEAELNREMSLLDPTTEVYNRRYLRTLLSKEASRAKRYAQGLSVIMTDVTGFRRVNDSLGHTGGDVVLRDIAQLLKTRTRNADYIVRFGADEFLIILPDTTLVNAQLLAGRIKRAFGSWTEQRGFTGFGLQLAIGVADWNPQGRVEEMLTVAERRMIEDAKTNRRMKAGEAVSSQLASSPAVET